MSKIKNLYSPLKNITSKTIDTNIVLIYRLILKGYGIEIYYIQAKKNIVSESLSRLHKNGDKNTTQYSSDTK